MGSILAAFLASKSHRSMAPNEAQCCARENNVFAINNITFFANFDSGNLARVEQEEPSALSDLHFTTWTRPDCHGTEFENRSRSWFFFGVAGVPPDSKLQITVRDLNPLNQLFSLGMQPVWRVGEEGVWGRVGSTEHVMKEEIFSITFSVTTPPVKKPKALYFALTTPYTYTHLQSQLHTLEAQHGGCEGKIYFLREMIANSLEGRRLDLLTISSTCRILSSREQWPSCVTMQKVEDEKEERPHRFCGKRVIFLSSRVHPGETCSSFVMDGFLRWFTQGKKFTCQIIFYF